jgi:hypothetical protein
MADTVEKVGCGDAHIDSQQDDSRLLGLAND